MKFFLVCMLTGILGLNKKGFYFSGLDVDKSDRIREIESYIVRRCMVFRYFFFVLISVMGYLFFWLVFFYFFEFSMV